MPKHDHRDLATGAVLLLLGLSSAAYTAANYRIGSIANIGPGLFPLMVSLLLAGFGLTIGALALNKPGRLPAIHLRPAAAILGSTAAFAIGLDLFGLLFATSILVLIASSAESRPNLLVMTLLAAGLGMIAVVVFRWGLGIQLPLVKWGL